MTDFVGGNTIFCRVDIKEVPSLKYTFEIESTPTFKILIAQQQVSICKNLSKWRLVIFITFVIILWYRLRPCPDGATKA